MPVCYRREKFRSTPADRNPLQIKAILERCVQALQVECEKPLRCNGLRNSHSQICSKEWVLSGVKPFGEDLLRKPQSSQAVMRIPLAAHDPRSERIRHAIICRSSPRKAGGCCVKVHEMNLPDRWARAAVRCVARLTAVDSLQFERRPYG